MNTTHHHVYRLALSALTIAGLGACASAPVHNPAIDEAQAAYDSAASDPLVARSAPLELGQAQQALAQANAAKNGGNDTAAVEHYVYLARQRTDTALQAGKIAQADQAVADASKQRDSVLIESRTREAQTQSLRADNARLDAEVQRNAATAARSQTATARDQTEAAQALAAERLAATQASEAQASTERAHAKSLEDQLAAMKARPTDRGMVLTLGDMLFDTGRAELNQGAKQPLDQLAAFLNQYPARTITIEGYTDSAGSSASNQALSERRASTIKMGLSDRGIALNRISAHGMGEASPVASNDTAAGRQRNRRVEIVLSDAK